MSTSRIKLPLFIPILADRLCASLTSHSTIHASLLAPIPCGSSRLAHGEVMTLCGSHAFIVAHATTGLEHAIAATWPPPILDRCEDCARLTGIGRRQQKGSAHWTGLSTPTPTPTAQERATP